MKLILWLALSLSTQIHAAPCDWAFINGRSRLLEFGTNIVSAMERLSLLDNSDLEDRMFSHYADQVAKLINEAIGKIPKSGGGVQARVVRDKRNETLRVEFFVDLENGQHDFLATFILNRTNELILVYTGTPGTMSQRVGFCVHVLESLGVRIERIKAIFLSDNFLKIYENGTLDQGRMEASFNAKLPGKWKIQFYKFGSEVNMELTRY